MATEFDPSLAVVVGSIGAVVTIGAVSWLAVRWKRRSGCAYGMCAFLFYGLLFLATFQHSILNADTGEGGIPAEVVTILVLGQGTVSAIGVGLFTVLLFGLFLAMQAELDRPINRIKAYAGCALFCVSLAFFFNPIAAAKKLTARPTVAVHQARLMAKDDPLFETKKLKAKTMVERLQSLGVVTRIETDDSAVSHFVLQTFAQLPDDVIEEYTQAALIHHIYVNRGELLPIVLRGDEDGRRIAVRHSDGRFERF